MEKQIPQLHSVAVSLMGHDKGRVYLVVKIIDPEFVLVCDGKTRQIEHPKKKRFKHLKILQNNALGAAETPTDAKIVKILKEFK